MAKTLESISIDHLYQHCLDNISTIREIIAPLTNYTLIQMSDYAWDKLDLYFDGDSLSVLYTIEELISQRRFSLESVDLVLHGKKAFHTTTLQQMCVISDVRQGAYLKRKELKLYFERFQKLFSISIKT